MDKIQVSVICLAYNHEMYIRDALEGFVNQKTNFKYEVLINDDCSTDKTADIIREYEEKYPDIIKPIYQKENQYSKGVQIGRDILFPVAKGQYLAFCEGDDYWIDENKLQIQYDFLENNKDCVACAHDYKNIGRNGKTSFYVYKSMDKRVPMEKVIMFDGIAQTASIMYKKEILVSITQEFSDLKTSGDCRSMLWARLNGNIGYINKIMSVHRNECKGSVTEKMLFDGDFRKERLLMNIDMLDKLNKYTNGKYIDAINDRKDIMIYTDALCDKSFKRVKQTKYYKNLNLKHKISIFMETRMPKLKVFLKKMGIR